MYVFYLILIFIISINSENVDKTAVTRVQKRSEVYGNYTRDQLQRTNIYRV